MNENEPKDALTAAVAAWVTWVWTKLDHQKRQSVVDILGVDSTDVRVVVRLKEGAILLEGTNEVAGKRLELFRQDVEPLRPMDAFGHQDEGSSRH